ncbi:hypothetical protein [Neomoorella thermoacetica]|uniref:hypothetical protein n=1 Tax=Neomoorella thermoacetica TaxID=1525 RepID=UPI0008FA0CA0|nr:hypothetical protein [Moorella thermoacetica]OIQ11586.1 hypothetical protein MOOTH_15720 [Moorella thermoacetica]OIQ53447.1 hypothetical protein MORE_21750 [Moorella thermoacetica]OIQ59906.1 hypothetical protein MTIN_20780 [Moorella thermoacetica]
MEETKKEAATTGEPPHRLVSEEFFFLLNRIDRLDEKMSAGFSEVRKELNDVRKEIGGVYRWSFGLLVTMLVGFAGVIVTLALGLR